MVDADADDAGLLVDGEKAAGSGVCLALVADEAVGVVARVDPVEAAHESVSSVGVDQRVGSHAGLCEKIGKKKRKETGVLVVTCSCSLDTRDG